MLFSEFICQQWKKSCWVSVLTLNKAMGMVKSHKAAQAQLKTISSSSNPSGWSMHTFSRQSSKNSCEMCNKWNHFAKAFCSSQWKRVHTERENAFPHMFLENKEYIVLYSLLLARSMATVVNRLSNHSSNYQLWSISHPSWWEPSTSASWRLDLASWQSSSHL